MAQLNLKPPNLYETTQPPSETAQPQLSTGKSRDEVAAECGVMRWGEFKPLLADALVEHLRPIQTRCAAMLHL